MRETSARYASQRTPRNRGSPVSFLSIIMFESDSDSFSSILTTSEEYQTLYGNKRLLTEDLSNQALHNVNYVILPNITSLRGADEQHHLNDLLRGMLKHAPHPLGERYVAVSLLSAQQRGEDVLVRTAKAWLDHLVIPSQFIYNYRFCPLTLCSVLGLSKPMGKNPVPYETFDYFFQRKSAYLDDGSIPLIESNVIVIAQRYYSH